MAMKTQTWPADYPSKRGNWCGIVNDGFGTVEYFFRGETSDDVRQILNLAVYDISERRRVNHTVKTPFYFENRL